MRQRSVAVIALLALALALQAAAPWVTATNAAGAGLVPVCTADGLLLLDPRDGSTRPAGDTGPDTVHACCTLCPGPCAAAPGRLATTVDDIGLGALQASEGPPPVHAVPPPSGDQGLGVRAVRGPPARA